MGSTLSPLFETPRRIGLDVGGVIIDAVANDGTDTDLRGDNFMKAAPVPGAYDAIKALVGHFGAENVFIISKCGDFIEDRTRVWLEGNDFYGYTGFLPANLYFCRTRPEKVPIARDLAITDFVDDRADVLYGMEGIVRERYLFGPESVNAEYGFHLPLPVKDWNEALKRLMETEY